MSIKCPFYINQDINKTFALLNFKCNEFDTYDNITQNILTISNKFICFSTTQQLLNQSVKSKSACVINKKQCIKSNTCRNFKK